jgi:hypothetical protein
MAFYVLSFLLILLALIFHGFGSSYLAEYVNTINWYNIYVYSAD